MERIRDAIEIAKARGLTLGGGIEQIRPRMQQHEPVFATPEVGAQIQTLAVDPAHLEAMRVVAHRASHPMSPAFDILRTTVLQTMDSNNWQTLVISSPTAECGKTVTAINLAMSIARMPGRQVVLLDLDMRRPSIGACLGVHPKAGVFECLSGLAPASDCMMYLDLIGPQLSVMPNNRPVDNPAEVISSRQVVELLAMLKSDRQKPIIIIDTPPMLSCDDVQALLPEVDCITLAIAEKMSKASEVEACEHHLKDVNYLGVILTKSQETHGASYY
jgi:protein-tyrosine kinase